MAGYRYLKGQYPPSYDKPRYQKNYDDFSPQDMYQAWKSSGQPVPVDPQSVYDQPLAAPTQAPQVPAADPCAGLQGLALIRCQNSNAAGMGDGAMMGGGFEVPKGLMDF